MFSVSTGCEVWFNTHYTRTTKSLEGDKEVKFDVWAPIAKQAKELNWHPETIINAEDVNWKDRIDIQAALQTSIDTGISSTINLKKDITLEEVEQLYLYAWEKGLKGVTIFRNGCNREGILKTSNTTQKTNNNIQEIKQKVTFDSIEPIHRSELGTTNGPTTPYKCACGKLYITCNKDNNNNLVEVFTHTSKGGVCQANLNAVTRLTSLCLRSGIKVNEIIDQLKGIYCPACQALKAKGNDIAGLSCPDIISKSIKEVYDIPQQINIQEYDECPECHQHTLSKQGGCVQCTSCGYSRCE